MELDMTKGSPAKLIGRFILPLILGNVFQQLYNMVDTIIVGRYLGQQALAAVGATGTIMFLILGFMCGLTTGFTILTAQRFGAGDQKGIASSVANAIFLSVLFTVVMTLISVLGMPSLLKLMQTPDDIIDMSYSYIIVICYGMGFSILYNILASLLRAIGNSKLPLFFLIISAILNIFLDIFLIVIVKLGVAGAAWATIISQGISGILCLIYIYFKVPTLHIKKEEFRIDPHVCMIELSVAVPMALQFSITAMGTMIVQAALNRFGSLIIASYTAASKVEQLVTQPFQAMGMTMATYSAQNKGIGDIERIKKGTHVSNLMSFIYAIIIAIVILGALPFFIRLFLDENVSEALPIARTYMIVCGACFTPLGMIFIFRNVLQGMGYAFWPMMGGVVELITRIIAAVFAIRFNSYTGVCVANGGTWLVTGIFLCVVYFIIMKKHHSNPTMVH